MSLSDKCDKTEVITKFMIEQVSLVLLLLGSKCVFLPWCLELQVDASTHIL